MNLFFLQFLLLHQKIIHLLLHPHGNLLTDPLFGLPADLLDRGPDHLAKHCLKLAKTL